MAITFRQTTDSRGTNKGSALTGSEYDNTLISILNGKFLSALDYGATGDGVTDDTTALQSALTSLSGGGCLYLPAGSYIVSDVLRVPAEVSIIGDGKEASSSIKMADGANLDVVLAHSNWYSNNAFSQRGSLWFNFSINGNRDNQASGSGHGIIATPFYHHIADVTVTNTRGNGIYFPDTTRNGTTITGTGVENKVINCRIRGCDLSGIRVDDNGAWTDGMILNNDISDCGVFGIGAIRAAGWRICGNRTYQTSKTAIRADKASWTQISGNLIDSYGGSADVGTYCAIELNSYLGFSGAQGTIISDNVIFNDTNNGSNSYDGIKVITGTGNSNSHVSITGNIIRGNGTERAIRLQGDNSELEVIVADNLIKNVGSYLSKSGDVTVYGKNTPATVTSIADGDATPSVLSTSLFSTSNTSPTTITNFNDGFIGQEITLIIGDSNTTIDFSGSNLKGNGGIDWSPSSDDFMTCTFNGTNWYCNITES